VANVKIFLDISGLVLTHISTFALLLKISKLKFRKNEGKVVHFYSISKPTDDDGRVHDIVLERVPPRMKGRFGIRQFEDAALGKIAAQYQSHFKVEHD